KLRPNLDARWNGTSFHSNSLGYRTPEVTLKKPADVYRMLVFGSSNSMGHGVDDGALYTRLLEQWLNERLATGLRVEVVNLSVAGESPSRRLQRLREEAGRYQADWILCDASPLDHALEEDHLEAIVRASPPIEIPFGYVREALLRPVSRLPIAPNRSGGSCVGNTKPCSMEPMRVGARNQTGSEFPSASSSCRGRIGNVRAP